MRMLPGQPGEGAGAVVGGAAGGRGQDQRAEDRRCSPDGRTRGRGAGQD